MSARKHPHFGDRIRGIWASESNPHRDGYFVEVIRRKGRMNRGTFYRCTDGKGEFWEYPVDSCLLLGPSPVRAALALAEALEKLANEVQALGAFREEVREAIGTTNLRVLEIRRDEARSALALYRGEEVQDGE